MPEQRDKRKGREMLVTFGRVVLLASFLAPGFNSQEPESRKEPVEVDWMPDRRKLREYNSMSAEKLIRAALEWLLNHQNPAGYWDCDGFAQECKRLGKEHCGDPGVGTHDVGVTGLALLALAGADVVAEKGGFREPMERAVDWLLASMDPKSGLIGSDVHSDFFYDHLIATYALCDALYTIEDKEKRARIQRAIDYVLAARNPYGGWRYDVPPIGDNDTSITAWALQLLVVAKKRESLNVPAKAIESGFAWIDEVTHGETGRVGYDSPGTLSSRTPTNERYPRDLAEALTGAGLWCRYLVGNEHRDEVLKRKQVRLLIEHPPKWDLASWGIDMYAWYYGTYALFQVGGKPWKTWNKALKKALGDSQHKRGRAKGSWDPVGAWGHVGGRVYSTALMALTLEVYWRYPRSDE